MLGSAARLDDGFTSGHHRPAPHTMPEQGIHNGSGRRRPRRSRIYPVPGSRRSSGTPMARRSWPAGRLALPLPVLAGLFGVSTGHHRHSRTADQAAAEASRPPHRARRHPASPSHRRPNQRVNNRQAPMARRSCELETATRSCRRWAGLVKPAISMNGSGRVGGARAAPAHTIRLTPGVRVARWPTAKLAGTPTAATIRNFSSGGQGSPRTAIDSPTRTSG